MKALLSLQDSNDKFNRVSSNVDATKTPECDVDIGDVRIISGKKIHGN